LAGKGFLACFFFGLKMLTGAFLRWTGADAPAEPGPAGAFAGEMLIVVEKGVIVGIELLEACT